MALVSLIILSILFSYSYSQSISTSAPVPPLQWINLSSSLSGTTKPPPLKDATIGYNPATRVVLIFGGVSQNGFPSSETYLLSLDNLVWSKPSPPANLQDSPSPRSASRGVTGPDFAANSRNAFMIYGGQDANGGMLTDLWEFDFNAQFWHTVEQQSQGPGAVSGIAGGIDIRTQPVNNPTLGLVNQFYVITSDASLWSLNTSGTLASNLPDSALAMWGNKVTIKDAPPFADSASTVIGSKIVSVGGCTSSANNSCTFIVNANLNGQSTLSTVPGCESPRTGAGVVPNLNSFSTEFSSQIFLLLGTLNSGWNDDDGLQKGEVAVLDTNTGTWSRIIPAGDPSSTEKVPRPREGAAVFALGKTATSRNSSDTLVFGGRDSSGNFLNDVWLLRSYSGLVSPSSPKWAGFGDGNLQTGINADGAGVTVDYLTRCAFATATGTSTSSTPTHSISSGPTNTPTTTGSSSSPQTQTFDTSTQHKVLSPVSLAILLLSVLLHRTSSDVSDTPTREERRMALVYTSGVLTFAGYALGIAGLVTSFTTISQSGGSTLAKRSTSTSTLLKTAHGRAGLAFFVVLYGLVPVLYLLSSFRTSISHSKATAKSLALDSEDKTAVGYLGSQSHSSSPLPPSPRSRTQSWGPSTVYRPSQDRSEENETLSNSSSPPQKTFEVLNRPKRGRRASGSWLGVSLRDSPGVASRSLSNVDWLQRRRSVNAVGELDYAISQAFRAQELPPTPATTDVLMAKSLGPSSHSNPKLPSALQIGIHIMFQASLLGLCVVALIALWTRTSTKAFFAVFLVWILSFYAILFALAWKSRPSTSILSVIINRFSGRWHPPAGPPQLPTSAAQTPEPYNTSTANTPTFSNSVGYPFPSGPYIHHHPAHRSAPSNTGPDDFSYVGPRSVETDHDDEDEDEDITQQRIESEMGRRDVSIVTVPKRKLWIANPS